MAWGPAELFPDVLCFCENIFTQRGPTFLVGRGFLHNFRKSATTTQASTAKLTVGAKRAKKKGCGFAESLSLVAINAACLHCHSAMVPLVMAEMSAIPALGGLHEVSTHICDHDIDISAVSPNTVCSFGLNDQMDETHLQHISTRRSTKVR